MMDQDAAYPKTYKESALLPERLTETVALNSGYVHFP